MTMVRSRRDWQRWARRGTTTQRGYGYPHQRLLKQRREQWRPGDLCAHCGNGIWTLWLITPDGKRVSAADLPHNDDRTGYLAGLAHRACNRRDGQAKTAAINRARGLTPAQMTAIRMRQWQAARRW